MYLLLLLIGLLLPVPKPASSVKLHFVHQFGDQPFQLNAPYQTLNGDSVTFTRFTYYVSNVTLHRPDGTAWRQPESYHLIDLSENLVEIMLDEVPAGTYTHVSFAIGVDSLRNHSGEQTGALNPDNGMFWMWESGYVFLKSEGYVHHEPGKRSAMVHHIGRDDCYQVIKLPLPRQPDTPTAITVVTDAQKLFGGFTGAAIRVKAPADHTPMRVMGGNDARLIARNCTFMFSVR